MRELIRDIPNGAPALGPYSPAVVAEGKFVFVSGQIPYCPDRKQIVRGSVEEQTRLVLENVRRTLEASGSSLAEVIHCKIYLQQLTETNFKAMNAVFEAYFGGSRPSRSTIGAQLLNFDVEIDCIARVP